MHGLVQAFENLSSKYRSQRKICGQYEEEKETVEKFISGECMDLAVGYGILREDGEMVIGICRSDPGYLAARRKWANLTHARGSFRCSS